MFNIKKFAKDIIGRSTSEQYLSIYPGTIEFVHDPLQTGRVKVRVPSIHVDDTVTPTENLPWAKHNKQGAGGHDYGQHFPPVEGSGVWVMFQNGDPHLPIIMGGNSAIPRKRGLFGANRPDLLPVEEEYASLGKWKAPEVAVEGTDEARGVPELPVEMRQATFHEPTVWVPFKTPKGAAIIVEEKDTREHMEILDRAGQGIQMKSRVRKDLNQYNGMQRGLRSVFRGDQHNYKEHTDNRESSVSVRDLAQQGMHTEARKYAERVKVVSKSSNNDDGSNENFDSGETFHSIELEAGHKRTVIEGRRQGRVMFKLSFDSQRGVLNIESATTINMTSPRVVITSPDITLKGDVLLDGDLMVSGDATVVGALDSGSPERDIPTNYT